MTGTLGASLSAGLAGKSRCGEPVAGMGRRDSASAFSAAASRCVASLLACCAGKRFAFPQLRTLSGSNPSAMGPKMKGPHSWEPIKSVVGDEGFEPPALCV